MTPRSHTDHERGVQPRGMVDATRCQTLAEADEDDDAGLDDLAPPPRAIGRFVVLRRVGRGSMGEVYSAFDDELGRRVAIKLVRRQPKARKSRRARMRREAQAMAKVSHPNVIQVFEVGEHDERTFIAMEYVEGQTLERWQRGLRGTPRSREQILDVYLQAGAGLVAAHRAGVLHRDFKPANVLVDVDGRAHVMDFGLAAWLRRADSSVTGEPLEPSDAHEPSDALDGPRLTRAGTLLGTPAFMSPEQYLGNELDARSDQFSFCVALWEALAGVHPFGAESLQGLRESIVEGRLREGAPARALPQALRRALRRGMAKAPHDRWPDMQALLDALRPRPRRARWAWGMAGAVVLAGGGVAWGAALRRPGLCEGAPEQLARVWSDEHRTAAREGLAGSGVALAEATWPRVEAELDGYVEAWAAARHRICEATHVHGEQSAELMDQRMACLDLRLHALQGLLGTFESADLETVLRAVDASARLPDAAECETSGVGELADPEVTRPESAELRRRLVVAHAHLGVGRMADAHAELDAIRNEALALGLPRLAAEALVARGKAEVELGRLEQADATLEAGLWEALARRHDEAALSAAIAHMLLVGATLGDAERGRADLARSEALLQRVGGVDSNRMEQLAVSGVVLARHGEYREAKRRLDEALPLARQLHGTESVDYGRILNSAGMVAIWSSDYDAAHAIFEELVELDRRLYAPGHLMVASALSNLAIVEANEGDVDGAEQRFREVLDVRRRVLGEQHVEVADSHMNLAAIAHQRRQWGVALPHLEAARAIYAATSEHTAQLDDAELLRGMILVELDRDAEAEPILRGVLARQRELLGERHADLVRVLGVLGRLLTRPGDASEAVTLLRLAVEIQRERLASAGLPAEGDALLDRLVQDAAAAEAVLRGGRGAPR